MDHRSLIALKEAFHLAGLQFPAEMMDYEDCSPHETIDRLQDGVNTWYDWLFT